MTQSTPERLARTDFRRLIPTSPQAARERLEALISDPEALALYADSLSAQDDPGPRPAAPANWGSLRRRILAEGLGDPAVDAETLAWLALDFDALAELQFDLYSTDVPPKAWLRAMEGGAGECPRRAAGETGPVDVLPAAPTGLEGLAGDPVPTPGARGEVRPWPEGERRVAAESPSPALAPAAFTDLGGLSGARAQDEGCDTPGTMCPEGVWESRLNFQRCLFDRRGWLHWSNLTVDDPTNGPHIVLFVHHDTMAAPPSVPLDVDSAWATVGASSAGCLHVLGGGVTPRRESRVIHSSRACDAGRLARAGSLLGWLRSRVPFSRLWAAGCYGPASHAPVEGDAHLGELLSKLGRDRGDCGLVSLVLMIDAGFKAPFVDSPGADCCCSVDWCGPGPPGSAGGHAACVRGHPRQLRAPRTSESPDGAEADAVGVARDVGRPQYAPHTGPVHRQKSESIF